MSRDIKGFTLVELSIVLVILALILTGVVVGGQMIRNAQVQTMMREVQSLKTVINTFKLKYTQLPGDLRNADEYWPGEASNGNGDGYIQAAFSGAGEEIYFWDHMKLSGLAKSVFEGEYVGTNSYVEGYNIPGSKLDKGTYQVHYHKGIYARNGNAIDLAGLKPDGRHGLPVLTAPEAFEVDEKMDDGIGNSGNVLGRNPVNNVAGPCVDQIEADVADIDEDYMLENDTEIACSLLFFIDGRSRARVGR